MAEKRIEHRKICVHRGLFDLVEIGVAKIVYSKTDGFWRLSSIAEIEISEPFKGLMKKGE